MALENILQAEIFRAVDLALSERQPAVLRAQIQSVVVRPRMRTVRECAAMLRELDSETAVTEYALNSLVSNGALKAVRMGRKRLINFDVLLEYLSNPPAPTAPLEALTETTNGIRRLG